ncbi:MAG: EAL domain-containing protein [Magnetococcales bacterium]|nr:EAL domain-containing protein [Magnetococcales bacterium]
MSDKHNKKEKVLQKLQDIRKKWADNLPEKIQSINNTWNILKNERWDDDLFNKFHRKVHTLAGSGGTFGFVEVGLSAREAEILIKLIIKQKTSPTTVEINAITHKLDLLFKVCQQALKKDIPPPPIANILKISNFRAKNQADHLIYLVEDDAQLGSELKRQLELYKFSVVWFDTLAAFQDAFKHKEPAVVIMDIMLPDGDGTEVLAKLQKLYKHPINTIFISVYDDIHNRLNAIRAGGEIFLNKPLDVAEIVDKLGRYITNDDSNPFRILIVDDSVDLSNHYSMLLQEAGMETAITNDPLQTFAALADFTPDLILMDLYMPECSGQELAQLIRQREAYISIPIVFLSFETDQESQQRALNLGGDDFLTKTIEPEHLVEAVIHRAKRSRQISSHLTRDELTGLPNRNSLKDRLTQAIRQTQRAETKMGLCVIDLDLFKKINDSLGHMFGDKVLKEIANRIKNCLRPGDTACRLGGDEFAIIYVGIDGITDIEYAVSRIKSALCLPISLDNQTVHLSASIGITIFPDDSQDIDALIQNAELALHAAKEGGRNKHQIFVKFMGEIAERRMSLEGEMRQSILNEDFILNYQPKIELPSRNIVGMEALVRWKHPIKGMISPVEFIPLAEETGLIIPLGEWILDKACYDTKQWLDAGHDLRVAVNLSSRQFQQQNLVKVVEAALRENGLPNKNLELEITESMVMGDMEKVITLLQDFRNRDIHISVDDFGTGYSSLSYLKRFPIHALKIDQSFIRDMHTDEDDSSIVKAIVSMGQSLRLNIIAEGVEQIEHLDFLEGLGCQTIQGYYFSKPLEKDVFSELLKNMDSNIDPKFMRKL